MRRSTPLAAIVLAAALAGCGSGTTPAAAPATIQAAPTVAALPTTTVAALPTVAPEPAVTSWVMPNLVGTGLQDAQNAIQSLTGYGIAVTTSHDSTGAGRSQVLDRNWQVCEQNIPAGKTITADSRIDFGAVKLKERC